MRRTRPILFALLLASIAQADATVPVPPGELLFDGATIDLRAHRVVRRTPSAKRCTMEDGPHRRAWSSPAVKKWSIADLSLADLTAHHLLLHDGFWSKRPRATIVDLDAGKIAAQIADRGDALVERRDGTLVGVLVVDEEHHELRLLDLGGKPRWRRAIPNLWGDSAAVLLDGDRLVVALFHRIATGSALLALNVQTGEPRWTADVKQMLVAHSKYFNDVALERVDGEIAMRGYEAAGCYLQTFDAGTGARTFALMPR